MKQGRVNAKYEEKYIRANRTFPAGNTVLLIILIAVQIGLVIAGFAYEPKPQDVIHQYQVTVQPLEDGSLDIAYRLVWEALDESEELTWVEIGMANENFTVYPETVSDNIRLHSKNVEGDYVSLRLDFKRAYLGGDVIDFSFKINQKDMLCQNEKGYFYEFVPGWFNAIQVESYEFVWKLEGSRDHVQRGSLDYGGYSKMTIQYDMDDFAGCQTVQYRPFNAYGAQNELQDDRVGVILMCFLMAVLLVIAEVYIVDSYVSYSRGRGFLTGHGYHVHTYGRSNPYYIRARNRYNAQHSGSTGGRSGGCACACACACAGGGRAGCSQKDTFGTEIRRIPFTK